MRCRSEAAASGELEGTAQRFISPLQGLVIFWGHVPRASPWAILFRPFRAKGALCVHAVLMANFWL